MDFELSEEDKAFRASIIAFAQNKLNEGLVEFAFPNGKAGSLDNHFIGKQAYRIGNGGGFRGILLSYRKRSDQGKSGENRLPQAEKRESGHGYVMEWFVNKLL